MGLADLVTAELLLDQIGIFVFHIAAISDMIFVMVAKGLCTHCEKRSWDVQIGGKLSNITKLVTRMGSFMAAFLLVVTGFAQPDFEYITSGSGAIYSLRHGIADTNDTVSPYPRHSQPACMKMGGGLKIKPIDRPSEETHWRVTGAELTSKVTNQVIWQVTTESDLMTISQEYELPNLPSYVDYVSLSITAVFIQGSSGGGTIAFPAF
jgi:hypothetical protein